MVPFWNRESGFIDGLCNSCVFVALLSEAAINHPTKTNQCFAKLVATSACDNVLLEHRLALDLNKRGLIAKMFPVMIGEFNSESGKYHSYRWPDLIAVKAVVVDDVEKKLNEHLVRQSLGSPLFAKISVKDTCQMLTRNQGCFIVGDKAKAFEDAACNILAAVAAASTKRNQLASARTRRSLDRGCSDNDNSFSDSEHDTDSISINNKLVGGTSFETTADVLMTRPLTCRALNLQVNKSPTPGMPPAFSPPRQPMSITTRLMQEANKLVQTSLHTVSDEVNDLVGMLKLNHVGEMRSRSVSNASKAATLTSARSRSSDNSDGFRSSRSSHKPTSVIHLDLEASEDEDIESGRLTSRPSTERVRMGSAGRLRQQEDMNEWFF
jgi:hypothetical protein